MKMVYPNYVTNPYHEAFDNYEFTQAMGDILTLHFAQEFHPDDVPGATTLALTGQANFQIMHGTFERATDEESLYYTLFPTSHDPLDHAAPAEQFANLRQDHREAVERLISARRRADASREAGVRGPSRSAWENAAGIAVGEALSRAEYGSHGHLYERSTLAEPEFEPAGPPTNYSRAEYGSVQEFNLPTVEERMERVREEAADSAIALKRELEGDVLYKALRKTQSEHPAKFKTFLDLLDQWKIDDPKTSAKYIKHIVNANMCTTANVRIWQITGWFYNGVPLALRKAQDAMAYHYMTEAWQASSLQRLEGKLGRESIRYKGENSDLVGTRLSDDDYWTVDACRTASKMANPHPDPVVHSRSWVYGFGEISSHSENGFFDYVPKGKGETTARHLLAHIEVRKVSLEHTGEITGHDRETRLKMLMKWGPRSGSLSGRNISTAEREVLAAACSVFDAYKATLAKELKSIQEEAAVKEQEKAHDRSQDHDRKAQPQKRAKNER